MRGAAADFNILKADAVLAKASFERVNARRLRWLRMHSQKGRAPVREPWVKSAMVYDDMASVIAAGFKKKKVRVADGIYAGHYI